MIVYTYVEAQRHVGDIDVARITIVVAVSNTERELPAAQRRTVVNSKKAGWTTFWTTGTYCWRLIAWVVWRPQSLC
jgi:hypothetical protein